MAQHTNDLVGCGLKNLVRINKTEYVRLCYKCHKAVHWCMDNLSLNWEKIEDNIKKGGGREFK